MHRDSGAGIEGFLVAYDAVALGHQDELAPRDLVQAHGLGHDAFRLAVGVNIGRIPLCTPGQSKCSAV